MTHAMQMHDRSPFLLNHHRLKVPDHHGAASYDARLSISATCGKIIEALGHYNQLHSMTDPYSTGGGTTPAHAAAHHASGQVTGLLNSAPVETFAGSDGFAHSSGSVQELLHGKYPHRGDHTALQAQVFEGRSQVEGQGAVGKREEIMDGVGQPPSLSHCLQVGSRGNSGVPWMSALSSMSTPNSSPLSGISSVSLGAISAGPGARSGGAYWTRSLLQDLSSPASRDGSTDYSDSLSNHSRQSKGNLSQSGTQSVGGNDSLQSDVDDLLLRVKPGFNAPTCVKEMQKIAPKLETSKEGEFLTKDAYLSGVAGDIQQAEKEESLAAGDTGTDCSDQDDMDVKPTVMTSSRGRRRQYTSGTASKNLVSERKRRKRLNDSLYALRALVPKISKMDKASIVGDAIEYVRELQQQVESLQTDISEIEADSQKIKSSCAPYPPRKVCDGTENSAMPQIEDGTVSSGSQDGSNLPQQSLLQVEISRVDVGAFQLRIFCKQGPGVLVQLMQTLEASGLDVLNANLTCFNKNVLNTFIAEMKEGEMKEEDVKATILKMAAQFGLLTETCQ